MHLSCTVTEIWGPKYIGVTTMTFGVTWRHRSRDHRTRRSHPIGGQWWPRAYLTSMEIQGFEDFGVTSLTFWGYVTSSVTWLLDSVYVASYWWSIVTMHLSRTVTEILGPKDKGVTSLTFWGHVTSLVTWPLDSAHVVSYWWSIGTKRLFCTVTEIQRFKYNGVTSLTFWVHVTSWVTWSFDSAYVVSY